ncbi:MAG TPA: hypothetical protein EYN03_04810 [Planctomycetes bacterium]|nr:hypothetical protein [Planctomycetaceae bacterium]HIN94946.1 hypothetical protein [Planctomycetota bacterium]
MNRRSFPSVSGLVPALASWLVMAIVAVTTADEPPKKTPKVAAEKKQDPASKVNSGLVKLTKEHEVWIDPKRKWVVVDGVVCLREGQLEMFACPRDTKEHESIVAVNCKARYVHAALLAVGSRVGHPVKFDPKYEAATGTVVDIAVLWRDKKGQKQVMRAQDWVQSIRGKKVLPYPWVFGGSGFWTDQATGERHYYGDGGDFICVSNFPSAMLDLPVESSQANSSLTFVAKTENIPPQGTKVRLVLMPRIPKKVNPPKETPDKPQKTPAKAKPPAVMAKNSPQLAEVKKLEIAAANTKEKPQTKP